MTTTYDLSNPQKPTILKDPTAELDYSWDWTGWLAQAGDSLLTQTIALDAPLMQVGTTVVVGSVITAVIEGGTLGMTHKATCSITTTGGREDDRSIYLKMVQR